MGVLKAMARGSAAGALLLLAACASTPSGSPSTAATTISADTDYTVTAHINGRPVRLRVDPGAPGSILINPDVASAARLIGTRKVTLAVGPERLKGKARSHQVTIGGITKKQQIMWYPRKMVKDADGTINPADLPWDSTRIALRAPQPGEQEIVLPVRYDVERGLHHELSFGGYSILTRFTLDDSFTTVTGAAGSVIAKRRGGKWKGPPFSHTVRYSIVRPVRPMVLSEPLSVKGFALSSFLVRTRDDLGDHQLAADELPLETEEEQSEGIVVTGKGRRVFGPAHFWLMIGRSDLDRCSSIQYDNKARRLILRCSPETPDT